MAAQEHPLSGGNATENVVRAGDTVRKPWLATTPAVNRYVDHLRKIGVDAPQPLGRDAQGRQMIEFVPGQLAQELLPLSADQLRRAGGLVRSIHDASAGYADSSAGWEPLIPVDDADLICHNDLAPWNLIFGDRGVFIDWDGAGPSTRLWDLAFAAQAFAVLNASQSVSDAAARLRAFIEGYDADNALRAALPGAIVKRTTAMYALLRDANASGREPWASMLVNGHGDYWRSASTYVDEHRAVWADALLN